ncbi:hypothetical protein [Oceanococcus atlanticus]|nr:hypothetical protein [Oceanococcus atlanticus]
MSQLYSHNRIAPPRRRMHVVASLLLLVLAQTSALLHAEVHAFHDAGELCTIFHNVEKQPTLFSSSGVCAIASPHTCEPPALGASQVSAAAAHAFQARAPPQFWFQTQS